MDSRDRAKWAYFGELFEAIALQGIDEYSAVEALLAALRQGLRAYGYRRQFTFTDNGRVERLPRDVHPQAIPVTIWRDSGEPNADLTSYWADDEEKPDSWISIDWVSGSVDSLEWEFGNSEHLRVEFSAVKIARKEADHLLNSLSGKPKKRAGRPQGPSNLWERDQVAAALQMIERGDTRPATAIATSLTDPALTGKALESQQRRLAWGINAAKSGQSKNPAKNKRD